MRIDNYYIIMGRLSRSVFDYLQQDTVMAKYKETTTAFRAKRACALHKNGYSIGFFRMLSRMSGKYCFLAI